MSVIELSAHRSHVTIQGTEKVHVVPESVFHDIIDGKMGASDVDEFDDMLPTILSGWLDHLSDQDW